MPYGRWVEPVAPADRIVRLEGARNFRDLGGYPTTGGGVTRWRRLYRSDGLHRLTPADVGALAELGLRVVYDLRRAAERQREPSVALGAAVRLELVTIGGASGRNTELIDDIFSGALDEITNRFMDRTYRRMVIDDAPAFGRLLTSLAGAEALPAVFHCSAGKDRTGVAAALLLSVLGVEEPLIVEDYALTGELYSARRLSELRPHFQERGRDIERFRALFDAPGSRIEALLETVRAEHGGAERYLVDVAGVEPATIDELRRLLVEPAPGR